MLCGLAGWFGSAETRTSLLLVLGACVVSMYAADIFFIKTDDRLEMQRQGAAARGIPYDDRSVIQVIRDMRAEGKPAWPAWYHHALGAVRKAKPNDALYPLSGVSTALSVFCNEQGPYLTYDSDEFGFNNPAGRWQSGGLKFMGVGDSFLQGVCVARQDNIVEQLAPRLGQGLNLGIAHGGPPEYLAHIVEYGRVLKPKLVLWFHFEENDLSPFQDAPPKWLETHYRDPGFSQNLYSRHNEVDAYLREALQIVIDDEARFQPQKKKPLRDVIADVAFLRHLRYRLGVVYGTRTIEYDRFEALLARGRDEVKSWGGELVVVYLPGWRPAGRWNPDKDAQYLATREVIERVGVPMIDVYRALSAEPDPTRYYPFPGAHFNEAGYHRTAEVVGQWLANR